MAAILRRAILTLLRARGEAPETGELPEGPQDPNEHTVEWLQASLNELGAEPQLQVDGIYGEQTEAAVEWYQAAHPPLVVDGIAGEQTVASIVKELES